ncbi:MAG: response regulator [Firmicutes bacterium]|nr:response regulator [Bacillota bacterium]
MAKNHKIYLVDDSDTYRAIGESILKEHYTVLTFPSGEKLLEVLQGGKNLPDLILLDVEMDGMTGFETIEELKANPLTMNVPVIFLTGLSNPEDEAYGFSLGATDYLTKPFSAPRLLKRLTVHLRMIDLEKDLANVEEKAEVVAGEIVDEIRDLNMIREAMMQWALELIEFRRDVTRRHLERIKSCMKILYEAAKYEGPYIDEVSDWDGDALLLASSLHDVGKVKIPDLLVLKKTRLTDSEREIMHGHCEFGRQLIENLRERIEHLPYFQDSSAALEHSKTFFKFALAMTYYHHEKWDGTGYPDSLNSQIIPLEARMMALVDGYDALVSKREYRPAHSHQEAIEIIKTRKGVYYDPALTDLFIGHEKEIEKINQSF